MASPVFPDGPSPDSFRALVKCMKANFWSKLTSNQFAAAAHCKGQTYIYSGGKP